MGLDGISVNQLRVTPEFNSAELNSSVNFNSDSNVKAVDGLSQGQRVDPDKRQQHEKNSQFDDTKKDGDFSDASGDDEISEETIKYDLSKSDKYCLKLDEKTDTILIIEKASEKIIQSIDAVQLSRFVNFLPNSTGAIVNKKY